MQTEKNGGGKKHGTREALKKWPQKGLSKVLGAEQMPYVQGEGGDHRVSRKWSRQRAPRHKGLKINSGILHLIAEEKRRSREKNSRSGRFPSWVELPPADVVKRIKKALYGGQKKRGKVGIERGLRLGSRRTTREVPVSPDRISPRRGIGEGGNGLVDGSRVPRRRARCGDKSWFTAIRQKKVPGVRGKSKRRGGGENRALVPLDSCKKRCRVNTSSINWRDLDKREAASRAAHSLAKNRQGESNVTRGGWYEK